MWLIPISLVGLSGILAASCRMRRIFLAGQPLNPKDVLPASEVGFSDVGTHLPVWHLWLWGLSEILMCCANGSAWLLLGTCCGTRLELELHQGWITTCETNSSKQSHFVQRIWSFSWRLVATPNSVHFQRDCAFVWICSIRREMNAWQCFVRT